MNTVAFPHFAAAGELAGVTMPDTVEVGGQTLVLNGMGLREFLFIDVYVSSLYLPTRTTSSREAIESDVPKRIVLSFVLPRVSREKMIATFRDGLSTNPDAANMGDRLETFFGTFETCHDGDKIFLDYSPTIGLSVTKDGRQRAIIPGADFMRAIWGMFLGDQTVSEALRDGMLGR